MTGTSKTVFVIMDGAADVGAKTPLELAVTPNLDLLAHHSYCGMWSGSAQKIGYNVRSLSEVGILQLLGYSARESPGRGYLEALGIGVKPEKGALYLRANFATVGKGLKIVDRRAGRDETSLGILAKSLSETIDEVKISLHRSIGHRGVLVLKGRGLSADISDADIGGQKPAKIKPLSKSPEAVRTAEILNRFCELAHEILSNHPANKKRKIPANYVLLRGPGMQRDIEPFSKRFGLSASCIANDGIVKGIARYIAMKVIDVPGITGGIDTNLETKVERALSELRNVDFVLVHIKGTDTCSHSKDPDAKHRFIERCDMEFFSHLVSQHHINIIVGIDHRTSSKSGEHMLGSVPFLVYQAGDGSNGIPRFTEKDCSRGFLTDNPMARVLLMLKR